MADQKLTALSAIGTLGDDDILYVVDDPGGSPLSRKSTGLVLKTYVLKGTATNDNAAAGQIGEYLSAGIDRAGAVVLTADVAANVTSLSLTAGDWDVTFVVKFTLGATTASNIIAAISTTTATLPGDTTTSTMRAVLAVALTDNTTPSLTLGQQRVSLASTTTYYLVARAGWTGGTAAEVWGLLQARRVR